MSFITSIVSIKAKKGLWLKKSDSRKMFGYAIKISSPYTQMSVVVLGRQGKSNNLVGQTNTALGKRSTGRNFCVCMSVHLYLRQQWKSKDPEPAHGWTVCEILVLEGSKVPVFVSVCVLVRGSLYQKL